VADSGYSSVVSLGRKEDGAGNLFDQKKTHLAPTKEDVENELEEIEVKETGSEGSRGEYAEKVLKDESLQQVTKI